MITVDVAAGCDFKVDVSSASAVQELADRVGPVSVLINSAGIVGPNKPLLEVQDDEWARTFAINVDGIFHLCRALVPSMVEAGWGRVVNLANMAGQRWKPDSRDVFRFKGRGHRLTKALGKELATTGVLVNAIAPAVIATPMNDSTAPEVLERLVSLIPMRRLGLPTEVSALVSWLASDECSFSTGAVYDISGGRATY